MTTRNGFRLIPTGAKIVAGVVMLAAMYFFYRCSHGAFPFGAEAAMILLIGLVSAAWVLLGGYIYADAGRRGMPQIPWTALAFLVPNCIGFVLYFLLRKPLAHPCPNCAALVPDGAAFCSRCGVQIPAYQA